MNMTKNFCRLITDHELDHDEVVEYFDIVQSYVSSKIIIAHTDDERIEADVIEYQGQDGSFVYEIVLQDQINLEEGEYIADELLEEFDFEFEFETSLEI